MQQKLKYFLVAVAVLLLLYFPIFLHLDTLPVRVWDEARLAVSAMEMLANGNWMVTHYEGKPEMWSTKPPLMIWLQVAFIRLLGPGELALRLPSALAAFLTCLILIGFSKKTARGFWPGLIAAMVLVTAQGYIHVHAARTGDYDALLTFFSTGYLFAFYLYLSSENTRWWWITLIFVLSALFTKSVQGLLFLPGVLLYLLLSKRYELFRKRNFWIGILAVLVPVAAYYVIHEKMTPGYLAAAWHYEWGGRLSTVIEEHRHPFSFYIGLIFGEQFGYWGWTSVAGLLLGLLSPDKKLKSLTAYLGLAILSYLLIISTAQTKLHWYSVPLFPLLALLSAIGINQVRAAIAQVAIFKSLQYSGLVALVFLIWIFVKPYQAVIDKVYFPKENVWDTAYYAPSYMLQAALKNGENPQASVLVYDDYDAHLLFYAHAFRYNGISTRMGRPDNLQVNDTVLLLKPEILGKIEQRYVIRNLDDFRGYQRVRVEGSLE